ncbi:hypothetical protein GCM10010178_62270 [Lentzea flava]|uniref:Helix-turn-helix domain-containing protein n=1 Tax=Lentzea flava TaxID=103732 RepID=A0ABQ2UZG0_9PSEU|nr:hypothetical protein GCM10010178_62270 [Lentzea flava]
MTTTRLVEVAARLSAAAEELALATAALINIVDATQTEEKPVADQLWLSSAQASKRSHRTASTVSHAAVNGLLHGHQAVPGGRWVFHADAIDAWLRGHDATRQREACGCDG